jgi:hypothetical protein
LFEFKPRYIRYLGIAIVFLSTFILLPTYLAFMYYNQDYIVIEPDFTASAYQPNGFYNYYSNHSNCCLTVPVSVDDNNMKIKFADTYNAKLLFALMGYQHITDSEVCSGANVPIDKILIILHNEYVCQQEYNIITNSTNVIYMYPNSLYANVYYNTSMIRVITLIGDKNHTSNYFNWTLDNTQYERQDNKPTYCSNQHFVKVYNGYQLNCWSQNPFDILKYIQELRQLNEVR